MMILSMSAAILLSLIILAASAYLSFKARKLREFGDSARSFWFLEVTANAPANGTIAWYVFTEPGIQEAMTKIYKDRLTDDKCFPPATLATTKT